MPVYISYNYIIYIYRYPPERVAGRPRVRRFMLRFGIRLLAQRLSSGVPRIGELSTARAVLLAHKEHGHKMAPIDVSACWNKLGRLARDRTEGRWLRDELRRDAALLAPLLEKTMRQRHEARPLANAVHGIAAVEKATRFNAGKSAWDGLADACLLRLREFNPQELANTVWAYANAGHASAALFDAVAAEATPRRLRDFKPQALANTMWAYAAADVPAAVLFGETHCMERCTALEAAFTRENKCQLHQWQLWLEERGSAWPRLPPSLAEQCRTAFTEASGSPSRLQRQVVRVLSALELHPREEVCTPQGYSLDAVVSFGGCDVAVEVDGPSHFLGRRPTGATTLKRRQLRAAGWALFSVPYWEWNALGGDNARQRTYLKQGLRRRWQQWKVRKAAIRFDWFSLGALGF